MNDLEKNNKELQILNDDLNSQIISRKEKLDSEMNSLFSQFKENFKKQEFKNFNSNYNTNNNYLSINSYATIDRNMKIDSNNFDGELKNKITELKIEIKNLTLKYEEIKYKYEKEILEQKRYFTEKENKFAEIEKNFGKKEKLIFELTQKNKDFIKENIEYKKLNDELNTKFKQLSENPNIKSYYYKEFEKEIITMKHEYEKIINLKVKEMNELKNNLEVIKLNEEKLNKKVEDKNNKIILKDLEINRINEILKEFKKVNKKISSNNSQLKKEYFNLQPQCLIVEKEQKNKHFTEIENKNKEIKSLYENNLKNEKYLSFYKEKLIKIKGILNNKKEMNLFLCDLAKIKNSQVKILENLENSKSEKIKKNLEQIKIKENKILEK